MCISISCCHICRPLGSGSTRTPAFGCVGRSRSAVPPPQLQSSALVLFLAARTQRKPRTPNVPPAAAGRRLPTEAAETCCKSCRQCGPPVCSWPDHRRRSYFSQPHFFSTRQTRGAAHQIRFRTRFRISCELFCRSRGLRQYIDPKESKIKKGPL